LIIFFVLKLHKKIMKLLLLN